MPATIIDVFVRPPMFNYAIPEEQTVKIYQSIPNAQLCIVPGSMHYFANEKRLLFNILINDFFEKPFTKPSTVEIAQKMAERMMGK